MAGSMRQRFERAEDERLAPCALRSSEATRRYPIEDAGRAFDYRSNFQRDRDRIVYSRAFRRLRQKAQVGILPAYEDHRRNRLTHSLEVAQLARTIGRALALNEDLIEAIALGHDLGQPPFGPSGVRALDDLLAGRLDGRGGPGLQDLGGFRHSWQSLRVIDRIEKRYDHPGLNLTDPVREGILKCGGGDPPPFEQPVGVRIGLPPLFETQVVGLADRIAAALHDLDDALQAGVIEIQQVDRLAAVRELKKKLGASFPARASRFMKANAIHRGLVHMLVTGVILSGQRSLARWTERHEVRRAEDFRSVRDEAVRGDEVGLSPSGRRMLQDIEGFLEARVRRGFAADQIEARGRRVILGIFAAYHADPTLLDDHLLLRYKEIGGVRYLRDLPRAMRESEIATRYRRDPRFVRLLADHLAAMTDAFAVTEHARLVEMAAIPVPSAEQLKREISRRSRQRRGGAESGCEPRVR
jgi:dGTPase